MELRFVPGGVGHVKCPHAKRYPDGPDTCDINDKMCLLEEGLECDALEDIRRGWAEEESSHAQGTQV